MVAVSKKGFTKTAKKKASANDIDTLTLEEAIDTDWDKYPIKPGVVVITGENFRLHDVLYKKGDAYPSLRELDLRSKIVFEGKECGSIKDNFEYFFLNHLLRFIQTKKRTEIIKLFKIKADLDKEVYIESDYTFPGTYARLSTGEKIDISVLNFIVFGTRSTEEVEQKHYKFNEFMISIGEHLDSDGSKIKFDIVQDPESKQIHGRWNRTKPEKA